MAAVTFTVTPSNATAPFAVACDSSHSPTQLQAAQYACGVAVLNFSGPQHPEALAPRMHTFGVKALSAGSASSENYGAYCYDPNYNLGSPRGQQFNVSAGV
jgi:hypothetical protein